MIYELEDLPQHGVVLIPPTSPEYDVLLEDIRRRHENPVEGSPPRPFNSGPHILPEDRELSVILVNRSQHGIVLIQHSWTALDFRGQTQTSHYGQGAALSILLPFGLPADRLKIFQYWNVIFPGSKRYLTLDFRWVGDNTDVRLPRPDEMWTGGIVSMSGGPHGFRAQSIEKLTVTLDGVFFDDGGFAGPNRSKLWEQMVIAAELYVQVARVARSGQEEGLAPAEIFSQIEAVTGPAKPVPPPPPHPFFVDVDQCRAWTADLIARVIQHACQYAHSEEEALAKIAAWGDTPLPNFHRL